MSIESFRQLLLKKAGDNDDLRAMIALTKDEFIIDSILESLEKAKVGSRVNPAFMHTALTFNHQDADMLRDAIGHHASKHLAAFKAGNQKNADKHAKRALNLMHMADKISSHNPNYKFEHTPVQPWERNAKHEGHTLESLVNETYNKKHVRKQYHEGDYKSEPKGLRWGYSKVDSSKLHQPPHSSRQHHVPGETGDYPWHNIKFGVKTGEKDKYGNPTYDMRHIDIDPNMESKDYEEHAFDKHPAMEDKATSGGGYKWPRHAHPAHEMSEDEAANFIGEVGNFRNSDHYKNWEIKQAEKMKADPEAYKNRGLRPSVKAQPPAAEQPKTVAPLEAAAEKPAKDAPIAAEEPMDPEVEKAWNLLRSSPKNKTLLDRLSHKGN